MIRKIVVILSILFLFACASQQTTTEPVKQPEKISPPAEKIPEPDPEYKEPVRLTEEQKCTLKREAAQRQVRRVLNSSDAYIGNMRMVGTCGGGFCVLSEEIGDCGWIIQKLDFNGDDVPDKEAVWKPVMNEYTLEVFFKFEGMQDSPESFFTL